MSEIPLMAYVGVSAALFSIGLVGVIARRNVLTVLMSVELIFNAANLNLVAFNRYLHPEAVWGQAAALFLIAIAAGEAAVGMALVLTAYRRFKSLFTENMNLLKG